MLPFFCVMVYIKLDWPEVQDYMEDSRFYEEMYFDPNKNAWFIPGWLKNEIDNKKYGSPNRYDIWGIGPDIGDLDDAMG